MIYKIEHILKEVSTSIIMNQQIENELKYYSKDIVTKKDVDAERLIIEKIKSFRPHDLFISEEENHNDMTDAPTWIIDPIDGTLNFTRGIPQFGIQLALCLEKQPIFSAMYFPLTDTYIYAEKDKGCYIDHKRVCFDVAKPLDQSIVTFGDFSKSQPLSRPIQLELMSKLTNEVMKVRIYGASSTDFFYVVSGKTQAHILFTKRIWELMPGILMIKESGFSIESIKFDTVDGFIMGHKDTVEQLKEISFR
ncbi:MAG: inositol monophosphatase [Clostridiales bacterium]|nr:inositol monophosphatase [Clostridiales bacterium]